MLPANASPVLLRQSLLRGSVILEQMLQCPEQFRRVLDMPTVQRPVNIIDDHLANDYAAVRPIKQISGQGRSRDLGDVFVLTDGCDLVVIKTTHRDAIFNRNHALAP